MNSFANTPGENNWVFPSNVQVESLLNEMRGNLLEYLVAWNLAKHFKILKKFEAEQDPELFEQFRTYQSFILQKFPDLPQKLKGLAGELSEALIRQLPPTLTKEKVLSIRVIGKLVGTKRNEADILFQTEQGEVGLSLKMMHTHGFVNTKSGGAQSFIEKYFGPITGAGDIQKSFESCVLETFQQMVRQSCSLLDIPLEYANDDRWKDYLDSRLPGQQIPAVKEKIHQAYNKMAIELHQSFQQLYQVNPLEFKQCLLQLYGLSHPRNFSVLCFYDKDYTLDQMELIYPEQVVKELEQMQIQLDPPHRSSFNIETPQKILQVRIKPMNEFTVPSYKINCSVKIK